MKDCAIITYGETSSGKTASLYGQYDEQFQLKQKGLVHFFFEQIFNENSLKSMDINKINSTPIYYALYSKVSLRIRAIV